MRAPRGLLATAPRSHLPMRWSWRGGRRRNGEDEILTQYLWGSEVGTLAEGRRAKKSQPVSGGGVRPPQDPTMRGHDCLLDESQSPAAAHSLHKYYDMLSEYPQCVRRQAAPYHGNALGRSRRTRHIAASAEDPAYLLVPLTPTPLAADRPRRRRLLPRRHRPRHRPREERGRDLNFGKRSSCQTSVPQGLARAWPNCSNDSS